EETSGGFDATTRTYGDGRSHPALGPDPTGTDAARSDTAHHDRLHAEGAGGPGLDAFRPGPDPRVPDRGVEQSQPRLSPASGGQIAHELTAVQKALWIMGLTIGIAFV